MDFAFVPGIGDQGLERLAELLQRLPGTVVTLTQPATTVSTWLSIVDQVVTNMRAR